MKWKEEEISAFCPGMEQTLSEKRPEIDPSERNWVCKGLEERTRKSGDARLVFWFFLTMGWAT